MDIYFSVRDVKAKYKSSIRKWEVYMSFEFIIDWKIDWNKTFYVDVEMELPTMNVGVLKDMESMIIDLARKAKDVVDFIYKIEDVFRVSYSMYDVKVSVMSSPADVILGE